MPQQPLLLSLLSLYLLLWKAQMARASLDLSLGLQEEHEAVEYERCMSISQLHDVLQLAAWHNPRSDDDVNATLKSAIMLTSCR